MADKAARYDEQTDSTQLQTALPAVKGRQAIHSSDRRAEITVHEPGDVVTIHINYQDSIQLQMSMTGDELIGALMTSGLDVEKLVKAQKAGGAKD